MGAYAVEKEAASELLSSETTAPGDRLIELRSVTKQFAGVAALKSVSLAVRRGETHALVGANGAGKSTLGKIVSGLLRPDDGSLLVDGRPVRYGSPSDALRDGVTIIGQEIALVPQRTVLENVFLGTQPTRVGIIDRRECRRRFDELTEVTGFELSGRDRVGTLAVAQQQQVEIVRALARGPRLLVMDEPTASFTAFEIEKLKRVVMRLREAGTTIIYVTHHLDEVLELADSVTVLRDGKVAAQPKVAGLTTETILQAMLGRSDTTLEFPDRQRVASTAPTRLRVTGLTRKGAIRDVSLEVRAGEIVALTGLIGSGRSEVARAIVGADRRDHGEIEVDGEKADIRSPADAFAAGVVLLPESRKDQGLLMTRSLYENVTLPYLSHLSARGFMSRQSGRDRVIELLRGLGVTPLRADAMTDRLSGGNQQKVLFAKSLFEEPGVLVADEPTRGVDIGAKVAIYELLGSLAQQGTAILVISSEIEEVLGLAHRAVVMWKGRAVATLAGDELSEETILRASFGKVDGVAQPSDTRAGAPQR